MGSWDRWMGMAIGIGSLALTLDLEQELTVYAICLPVEELFPYPLYTGNLG